MVGETGPTWRVAAFTTESITGIGAVVTYKATVAAKIILPSDMKKFKPGHKNGKSPRIQADGKSARCGVHLDKYGSPESVRRDTDRKLDRRHNSIGVAYLDHLRRLEITGALLIVESNK